MAKKYFYFKLIPPRPTFAQDMTDEERALMQQHAQYARGHFDAGKLLLYGPVMPPGGAYGMAIVEAATAAEVRQFGDNDPSVLAGLNKFEFYPMHVAAARGL